jgi:hypothetical protein
MNAQPGRLRTRTSQLENRSRRHCPFATFSLPYIRLNGSISAFKSKKAHFVWCKVHLTLLPSAEFPKVASKKREKTSQNDPDSSLFGGFSGLFQHLAPSPDCRQAMRTV